MLMLFLISSAFGGLNPLVLPVDGGCRMDQGQIHAMEALRMSHKQISPGHEMLRKSINEFFLCWPIKIDERVAAKHDRHRFVYSIFFFEKIKPSESH
jgi:hypothetical protein